jgi:hypothetical protein
MSSSVVDTSSILSSISVELNFVAPSGSTVLVCAELLLLRGGCVIIFVMYVGVVVVWKDSTGFLLCTLAVVAAGVVVEIMYAGFGVVWKDSTGFRLCTLAVVAAGVVVDIMYVGVGVVWKDSTGFLLCTLAVIAAGVAVEITVVVGNGVLGLDFIIVLCSEAVSGLCASFVN